MTAHQVDGAVLIAIGAGLASIVIAGLVGAIAAAWGSRKR